MELARPGSDRPLRVVAYTDSAGIGGAEISLGHLVAAVAEKLEVTVVGVAPNVVARVAGHSSVPQIVLPTEGIGSFWAHWRVFQELRPDIIHCNLCAPWAGAVGLTAALGVRGARVVKVEQLPLRTTDLGRLLRTRWLTLRVDACVAVGKGSAKLMEDFYALGRGSVLSIPNGVPDLPVVPPPPALKPGKSLIVGSVGRLDAMKAHDVLLRAIAPLAGIEVVILGEGAEREALTRLAEELGIASRVKMPGWVEDPRDYLTQFDIYAQPSRSEGFPLAIVEAMLAARPVVATRVGGVAEAVIEGNTGFLLEKDDVDGLRAALRRLQDEPELRVTLGLRGRERAVAHFTTQQMAAAYERLWQNLVDKSPVPRLRVPRPRD